MEKEANEFASALLMPKAEIAAAFRVRRLDMARLAALKPEWRVSMQLRTRDLLMRQRTQVINALRWHLAELGIVAANSYCHVRGRLPIAVGSARVFIARKLIERFFDEIKQCRRIATRYDKLAVNYLAFIKLASIRMAPC